jgi:hypothetical protein
MQTNIAIVFVFALPKPHISFCIIIVELYERVIKRIITIIFIITQGKASIACVFVGYTELHHIFDIIAIRVIPRSKIIIPVNTQL